MEEIDNYSITQANALVYGSSSMTLREKRLFYLAVCKVCMHDNEFLSYTVPVETLKKYLGLKSNCIRNQLKQLCKKLLSRVVSIDTETGWKAHQYVGRCEYTEAKYSEIGCATLEIRLHEEVRPFLLQIRGRYNSIKFHQLNRMKSVYAMRIFEILWHKREEKRPKIQNKITFDMTELRHMMELEKKYKDYGDFRRYVLNPAQREMAKHTPIKFDYTEIRVGRKVIAIKFTLSDNKDCKANDLPPDTETLMQELEIIDKPKARKKAIWKHINEHMDMKNWSKECDEMMKNGKSLEHIEACMS